MNLEQAKQRAAEIVRSDSDYGPNEAFWNVRQEAMIAALFTIYKEREDSINDILGQTPDELYTFLQRNKQVIKPFWTVIEEYDEKINKRVVNSVQAILGRLLPFEPYNEYIN